MIPNSKVENYIWPKNYYGYAQEQEDREFKKQCIEDFESKGFDDTELWSLDHTLLKFLLPRLKEYYEVAFTDEDKSENAKSIKYILSIFEKYEKDYDIFSSKEGEEEITSAWKELSKIITTLWI